MTKRLSVALSLKQGKKVIHRNIVHIFCRTVPEEFRIGKIPKEPNFTGFYGNLQKKMHLKPTTERLHYFNVALLRF